MENSNNDFLKSTMTSGALLGIGMVIYHLILYIFNANLNSGLAIIIYVILIAGIIYGTKAFRDNLNGGYITYGKAVGTGTLIALFAGVVYGLYQYIYVNFIDPEFFDKLMETMIEQYQNAGIDDDKIEQMLEYSDYSRNPIFFTLSTVLGLAVIGLIISLITSFFLKKENDGFAEAMQNIESNDDN